MNKQINTVLAIAILVIITSIIGIIFWINNNKQNDQDKLATQYQSVVKDETSKITGDDFFPVQRIPFINDNFDRLRYSCGNQTIVPEIEKDENFSDGISPFRYATSIKIMPSNVELEKIDNSAKFISYTFDKECKNIFAIVSYQQNNEAFDIFQYNTTNGKYIKLTENLLPRFKSTQDIINTASATPMFIYTINDKKLLASFFGFTTGLDAYTNFTIHKIFNLSDNSFSSEIAFTDTTAGEWLLPPTILNFNKNILSNAIGLKQQSDGSYKKLVRKDYDLNSEKFISTIDLDSNLLTGNEQLTKLFFACPSKIDEPEEYEKCVQENVENIFPENKK
jgi:hypothetical protein